MENTLKAILKSYVVDNNDDRQTLHTFISRAYGPLPPLSSTPLRRTLWHAPAFP